MLKINLKKKDLIELIKDKIAVKIKKKKGKSVANIERKKDKIVEKILKRKDKGARLIEHKEGKIESLLDKSRR